MKIPKPKSWPTVFITTSICFPTSLISSRTRIKGDQFEQQDKRWVAGLDARHTLFNQWFGRDVENTFGLQVRNDWINNGLYQTEDRVRVDKLDSDTGIHVSPPTRKWMILRTRKSVFMWKIKFNGRKNSAPSRLCAATWTILM